MILCVELVSVLFRLKIISCGDLFGDDVCCVVVCGGGG